LQFSLARRRERGHLQHHFRLPSSHPLNQQNLILLNFTQLNLGEIYYIYLMETALEHILTSTYKDAMIAYLNTHPESFEEAITLAISDKQPYGWRSAWLLWSCMEENDRRIKGYIKKIINTISTKGDGHQRELLKILQRMELDEEDEGMLLHECVTLWEKTNIRPSVRYTAFMFMNKMVARYPDLNHEIELLTEDHYLETLSPGIKVAIKKIMKKL